MFENMTYENILESMLKNVPSDIDKREGSVIFDTLSPAALELANAYIYLDIILNNAFADTAEREYLILRAKERGLAPYEATKAVLKLEVTYTGTSENVSVGDRFSLDGMTYVVTEQMVNETDGVITTYPFGDGDPHDSDPGDTIYGQWRVECETPGKEGNTRFGDVLPLQSISELASAKITELLIPGEDTEGTEEFRERYFEAVNNDAFGGNRADYKKWLNEFEGVGMVKLVRTPESGGTVGVIITDSENDAPSEDLISNVKEWLDPVDSEGLGAGIAPIGHVVDVKGAEARQLSISVTWQLLEGANEDSVCAESAEIIKAYLSELNKDWEDTTNLKVNAFQLTAKLAGLKDIVDITELTIDGERAVTLNSNEIFDFNYIVFNGGGY